MFASQERNAELKRKKQQQIAEEEEKKRLASEVEKRKNQMILEEIRDKELEQAKALLEDVGKQRKRKIKKSFLDGVSLNLVLCYLYVAGMSIC